LSFSEDLGRVIMKNLSKLESLRLDFCPGDDSMTVIRILIRGSGLKMPHLRSLEICQEECDADFKRNDWIEGCEDHNWSYSLSNLEFLKLKFRRHPYGSYYTPESFLPLQGDIIHFCPKLSELYFCISYYYQFSKEFSLAFQEKFLQELNLKCMHLLILFDLDELDEIITDEFHQMIAMEEEVQKLKAYTREEDEVDLYFKTLMEEEEIPEYDEHEYFEKQFEEERDCLQNELDNAEYSLKLEEQERIRMMFLGNENSEYMVYYNQEEPYNEVDKRNRMVMEVCNMMEEEQAAEDEAETEIRFKELNQQRMDPQMCFYFGVGNIQRDS